MGREWGENGRGFLFLISDKTSHVRIKRFKNLENISREYFQENMVIPKKPRF